MNAIKRIIPPGCPSQYINLHITIRGLFSVFSEFKKEQVKIQLVPSTGDVKVSGERATNQNKHVRFEQTYKVPGENSDLNKITARFDGEILSITVPKQVVEKKSQNVEILYITIEKKNVEHEEGPLRIAMKTLSQNGVIIATALSSFSLGVLLSRRSQH